MPITVGHDSAKTRRTLEAGGKRYATYSIPAAEEAGLGAFGRLPAVLKVVLENMLRFEDGQTVTQDDVRAFAAWAEEGGRSTREIAYRPARVLMQDFTGVPAVVDLAAMRDGIEALGGDPQKINPLNPVDLVIDHSVMIDEFGNPRAFQHNVEREYERNIERYQFLKWGQGAFDNFRVVPPGTGICHQVNLEYLARTVWSDTDQSGEEVAYPDTLVGTDSHTTMVNGAAVLGWGVGGIEAEAAMLGQPISMLIPEVVGFKLTGTMPEGSTGTDLVLKVTQMLRGHGVVGKFVEFYGDGLDRLPLADRATIGNMAPEYGATCGFFPIDGETVRYLRQTGRDEDTLALVEAYARAQGMWRDESYDPVYTETLELDMGTVVPAISGPKRPQDHIALSEAAPAFAEYVRGVREGRDASARAEIRWEGEGGQPEPRDIPGDEGHHVRGYVSSPDGNYQLHDRLDRDRLDHVVHQHLQPLRDDRRRAGGEEGARARPEPKALGQDLARAGFEGGHGVSGGGGAPGRPRRARLRPRGLRLHDVHRQLGALGARDLEGDQRLRPDRGVGALGQPQLRGAHPSRRARQLPRLAPARGGLRARGRHERGHHHPAAGPGPRGARRVPARHLAVAGRDRRAGRGHRHARGVSGEVRLGLRGRRALARGRDARLAHLRLAARTRPTCRTRPTSGTWTPSPAPSRTWRARASSPSSATW